MEDETYEKFLFGAAAAVPIGYFLYMFWAML